MAYWSNRPKNAPLPPPLESKYTEYIDEPHEVVGWTLAAAFPYTRVGQAVIGYVGRRMLVATGNILADPHRAMAYQRRGRFALDMVARAEGLRQVYHSYRDIHDYQSSGRSSQSYQQSGSPGGTPKQGPKPKKNTWLGYTRRKGDQIARPNWKSSTRCKKGWTLRRMSDGKYMCVKYAKKTPKSKKA